MKNGIPIMMILIIGLPCLAFGIYFGWHWFGDGCLRIFPPGTTLCGIPVLIFSVLFLVGFAVVSWFAYYLRD